MIQPGTLCMIRGITKPEHKNINGMIVQTVSINPNYSRECGQNVWGFTPEITSKVGTVLRYAREQHLHPIDPCEDDLARETLERLEEQMRETFINTVLEKI